jgi:hypothetical protein
LDTGFTDRLYTPLGTTGNYGATANIHSSTDHSKRSPSGINSREEIKEGPEMQQWQKELKPKREITSGKQENTQQDLQANRRAGGLKANSRDFQ